MSPRIIQLPMSGGDRRHYARELARVERLHADLVRQLAGALATAHRLACEEWNARQFIGGEAEPSPTIAEARSGGCELLEVRCQRCGHADRIDLAEIIWPSTNPIHTLKKALACRPCKVSGATSRPDLVALVARHPPEFEPPAAAQLAGR
jgi:hypothetical protein